MSSSWKASEYLALGAAVGDDVQVCVGRPCPQRSGPQALVKGCDEARNRSSLLPAGQPWSGAS